MLFLNPWLLAGLAAVSIPVIIHLVRQQAAKPVDWGAMRFLFDTIAVRRRKMEWEDLLLMAARCLLLGLVALAVARPFVTPDSEVPWLFVLPAGLLGIALAGASFVPGNAKARWLIRIAAVVLLLAAAALVVMEKFLNLKRFEASGRRDVALVIDASSSMELQRDGRSVFSRAVEDARQLVIDAPRGTAFTVVLGGPAPQALTAAPVTHRADVLGILDSIEPVGGGFRAHEALGMATLALAEGHNASKEIIVFTDAQRASWRFENPAAWNSLGAAWDAMPVKPKLLLRDYGAPADFHNVALADLSVSRAVVGTDREVTLRLAVANTGTGAITPGPVEFHAGGTAVATVPVGLLAPGQREVVECRHRFDAAGPQVVSARIDARDDLPADNLAERIVDVRDSLPVLLVDGNPNGTFFERAAGYTALALAPSAARIDGKKSRARFLMDPRVVPVTEVAAEDFEDAAVIVLADVSRLPETLANALSSRVSAGAGLFIIAGPRTDPEFFNAWHGADGRLVPVEIGGETTADDGVTPAAATFVHEALGLFADGGDLDSTRVRRWRKTGALTTGAVQAAAFSNGDVFLAARKFGSGRTMLATCAFDARSGNLPARRAFVPLVHELVTWSAGGGADFNVAASWSPRIALSRTQGGLSGTYLADRRKKMASRIDATIDFQWANEKPMGKLPRDNFTVVWEGTLTPPADGDYVFEAIVDDRIELRLGDHPPLKTDRTGGPLGTLTLKGGEALPVNVRYEEDGGDAFVRLFWTPPGGKKQIIPPSAFYPVGEPALTKLRAIDPKGLPREATLREAAGGRDVTIAGPAVPGIYQISTGGHIDGIAGERLPLAVLRDAAESIYEPMLAGDLAIVRKHIDLLQPASVADMIGVLEGKGFGREIWKWLAVSAFLLFLAESLLARWVSKSRRAAEDVRVDFGEATVWRGGAR